MSLLEKWQELDSDDFEARVSALPSSRVAREMDRLEREVTFWKLIALGLAFGVTAGLLARWMS